MYWQYIVLIILFLFVLSLFSFSHTVFHRIFVRGKPKKNDVHYLFTQNKIDLIGEEALRNNLQWVSNATSGHACIESSDGLRLHCALINVEEGVEAKGVVIIFHGYRSFGARDFCLQLPILHNAGYNIMLVDQRSHGQSEGKYISYGARESGDAILWRKKATEIYGDKLPIAFFGLSMGGATVIMASGQIEESDTQLKCVIADCPFYDTYGIILHVLWKYNKVYPYPIIYFVSFWSRFLADFNMRNVKSCPEQAKSSKLPFLIFHGKEDKFVPTDCSVRIAKELGDKARLVLIDNARHAESVYYNTELYKKELLEFLDKYMR